MRGHWPIFRRVRFWPVVSLKSEIVFFKVVTIWCFLVVAVLAFATTRVCQNDMISRIGVVNFWTCFDDDTGTFWKLVVLVILWEMPLRYLHDQRQLETIQGLSFLWRSSGRYGKRLWLSSPPKLRHLGGCRWRWPLGSWMEPRPHEPAMLL